MPRPAPGGWLGNTAPFSVCWSSWIASNEPPASDFPALRIPSCRFVRELQLQRKVLMPATAAAMAPASTALERRISCVQDSSQPWRLRWSACACGSRLPTQPRTWLRPDADDPIPRTASTRSLDAWPHALDRLRRADWRRNAALWWKQSVPRGWTRVRPSAAAPVMRVTLLSWPPRLVPAAATTIWPAVPEPRPPSCMCCAPPKIPGGIGRITPWPPPICSSAAGRAPCCADRLCLFMAVGWRPLGP